MQIKYTVSSCTENEVAVKATVAGREVEAKIPGLVVELMSEDGGMGHTYRLTPDDFEAAKDFFTIGEDVILTFSKPE
jgi:hypothetical protein